MVSILLSASFAERDDELYRFLNGIFGHSGDALKKGENISGKDLKEVLYDYMGMCKRTADFSIGVGQDEDGAFTLTVPGLEDFDERAGDLTELGHLVTDVVRVCVGSDLEPEANT